MQMDWVYLDHWAAQGDAERFCLDQVAEMPKKIMTSKASWMILCKANMLGRLPGEKLHGYITVQC